MAEGFKTLADYFDPGKIIMLRRMQDQESASGEKAALAEERIAATERNAKLRIEASEHKAFGDHVLKSRMEILNHEGLGADVKIPALQGLLDSAGIKGVQVTEDSIYPMVKDLNRIEAERQNGVDVRPQMTQFAGKYGTRAKPALDEMNRQSAERGFSGLAGEAGLNADPVTGDPLDPATAQDRAAAIGTSAPLQGDLLKQRDFHRLDVLNYLDDKLKGQGEAGLPPQAARQRDDLEIRLGLREKKPQMELDPLDQKRMEQATQQIAESKARVVNIDALTGKATAQTQLAQQELKIRQGYQDAEKKAGLDLKRGQLAALNRKERLNDADRRAKVELQADIDQGVQDLQGQAGITGDKAQQRIQAVQQQLAGMQEEQTQFEQGAGAAQGMTPDQEKEAFTMLKLRRQAAEAHLEYLQNPNDETAKAFESAQEGLQNQLNLLTKERKTLEDERLKALETSLDLRGKAEARKQTESDFKIHREKGITSGMQELYDLATKRGVEPTKLTPGDLNRVAKKFGVDPTELRERIHGKPTAAHSVETPEKFQKMYDNVIKTAATLAGEQIGGLSIGKDEQGNDKIQIGGTIKDPKKLADKIDAEISNQDYLPEAVLSSLKRLSASLRGQQAAMAPLTSSSGQPTPAAASAKESLRRDLGLK